MKFETKPLNLSQRIELNDVTEYKTDGGKFVAISNTFKYQVTALRFGLKTLNGVEIKDDNFDELANTLTNDEIKEIADQIAEESNFSKKKKS